MARYSKTALYKLRNDIRHEGSSNNPAHLLENLGKKPIEPMGIPKPHFLEENLDTQSSKLLKDGKGKLNAAIKPSDKPAAKAKKQVVKKKTLKKITRKKSAVKKAAKKTATKKAKSPNKEAKKTSNKVTRKKLTTKASVRKSLKQPTPKKVVKKEAPAKVTKKPSSKKSAANKKITTKK